MEEYSINLTHIEEKPNALADTFFRLPRIKNPTVGKKEASGAGKEFDFRTIKVPHDEEDVFFKNNDNDFSELLPTVCWNKDTEVLDCFLNLSTLQEIQNPVTVLNIQNHQAVNGPLQQM